MLKYGFPVPFRKEDWKLSVPLDCFCCTLLFKNRDVSWKENCLLVKNSLEHFLDGFLWNLFSGCIAYLTCHWESPHWWNTTCVTSVREDIAGSSQINLKTFFINGTSLHYFQTPVLEIPDWRCLGLLWASTQWIRYGATYDKILMSSSHTIHRHRSHGPR